MRVTTLLGLAGFLIAPTQDSLRAQDRSTFDRLFASEVQRVKKETSDAQAHKYLDMIVSAPDGAFLAYGAMTSPPDAALRCQGELSRLHESRTSTGQEAMLAAARAMAEGRGLRLFVLDAAADNASSEASGKFHSLYNEEAARLAKVESPAISSETKRLAHLVRTNYSTESVRNACSGVADVPGYFRKLAAQRKK